MGTNYYWRHKCCDKCGRYEELHIGKKSAGWKFSFRGHRDHQPPIVSWEDWRRTIVENAGQVFNEYDEMVPFNEFVAVVDGSRSEPRDHIEMCMSDPHSSSYINGAVNRGDAWHADGFSFSNTEFS